MLLFSFLLRYMSALFDHSNAKAFSRLTRFSHRRQKTVNLATSALLNSKRRD
jgi:hypothetical protein